MPPDAGAVRVPHHHGAGDEPMADAHDPNLATWGLGAVTLALSGAFTWLWNRLAGVEQRHDTALRDVWSAINSERDKAEKSRERVLERLSEIPTKDDFKRLEDRLTAALARHPPTP